MNSNLATLVFGYIADLKQKTCRFIASTRYFLHYVQRDRPIAQHFSFHDFELLYNIFAYLVGIVCLKNQSRYRGLYNSQFSEDASIGPHFIKCFRLFIRHFHVSSCDSWQIKRTMEDGCGQGLLLLCKLCSHPHLRVTAGMLEWER